MTRPPSRASRVAEDAAAEVEARESSGSHVQTSPRKSPGRMSA
jgi:hypothetical protein